MSISDSPGDGTAFIFTYPFWIYVDTASHLSVADLKLSEVPVRVYPPFRSGPANFMPAPHVDPHSIPFPPNLKPKIAPDFKIFSLAAVPNLGEGALSLFWGEGWGENPPNPFPMDSLRVDVINKSQEEKIAREVEINLLKQLRWRTRQYWIGRSVDPLTGTLRNTLPILRNGAAADLPYGISRGRTAGGDEHPVTETLWMEAVRQVELHGSVPVYHELLLDAYFNAVISDFRRATIDASGACEQCKDLTYERLWKRQSSERFRRGRVLRGYDLPKHIGSAMKAFGEQSYEEEHPEKFILIKRLWDARGNVAHGGPAAYRIEGENYEISGASMMEMVKAADHLVEWLSAL